MCGSLFIKDLSPPGCAQAALFFEAGCSYRRTGRIFGVSHTLAEIYMEVGEHLRRPGEGRNCVSTGVGGDF